MKPSHCTEKGDAQRCEQGIFEDLDIIKHKRFYNKCWGQAMSLTP